MTPFAIATPPQILFGRGEAAKAPALIRAFGGRGIVVHGANRARAHWLITALGPDVLALPCAAEPVLADLRAALALTRAHSPDWVVAIGGGAVLDMGKALAALIAVATDPMDHLEVVGRGLPLTADPIPFIAIPTTSGTGAEVTRNAVIGVPEQGRKVSLRDARMMARVAIVDPALTDHCPRRVTLASGLDALTQVIEAYVSAKATPFTDALTLPVIAPGLAALRQLMLAEDAEARDAMAWASLCGGLALSNAGLGAVHGLAGVIGGITGAAHGAICGTLLGPVLAVNWAAATGTARVRLDAVVQVLADAFGTSADAAPVALAGWARDAGLPDLRALGLDPVDHAVVAETALATSSMQGNPVKLSLEALRGVLAQG